MHRSFSRFIQHSLLAISLLTGAASQSVHAAVFGQPIPNAGTNVVRANPASSLGEQRSQFASDIEAHKSRRALGITGTVVGGLAILAGIVVGVSREVDDGYEQIYGDGTQKSRNNDAPIYIGLAVGIPLIAIGTHTIIDSSRQIRRLKSENVRLSFSQRDDATHLALALRF